MTREIFYELKETEGVPKKPGVDELLSYAKEEGYLLAVATSSGEAYSRTLHERGEGVWDYF